MRLKLTTLAIAAAFVAPVALAQTNSGTATRQYDAATNKEEPQKPGSGQANPSDPPAESAGKPANRTSPDTKRSDTGAAGENAMGGGAATQRQPTTTTTKDKAKTKPSDNDRRAGTSPGNANAAGEGSLGGSPDQQARKNQENGSTSGTTSTQPGR